MGLWISPADLAPFATIDDAKAAAMISDAEAMAVLVAPCLTSATFPASKVPALVAILRGALLRWNDAGTGALTQKQQQAGPWLQGESYDTRQIRKAMFWPSEIQSLQSLCTDTAAGGAFAVDTAPSTVSIHADVCSINFGATYCSCGAVLTGSFPLWETNV